MSLTLDVTISSRLNDVGGLAARLEQWGFGGLWTTESDYDPFLALVPAIRNTRNLTVGTAIATAFTRSPMITAVAAWDLHRASGGRFVLGLGTQVAAHNRRRFSVASDSPIARLEELVAALRHIWGAFQGEHRLAFQGRFYRHDLLTPPFNPGPIDHQPPQVFLAAVTPRAYRLAGEVADGVHVHPLHTAAYLRERASAELAEGLALSGRRRIDLVLAAPVMVVLHGDREAERAARERIAFYGSTPTYRPIFEAHGWGTLPDRLRALMAQNDFAGMQAAITDEMLEACTISAASWDDAAARIRERYAEIVDRVSVASPRRKVDEDELALVARAFHAGSGQA